MKNLFLKFFYKIYKLLKINLNEFEIAHIKKTKMICATDVMFSKETRIINSQNEKSSIKIGTGTHIMGTLLVFPYGGKIEIGDNCYIGEMTRVWSAEEIKIGNDVFISHNVNIIDTNSHQISSKERTLFNRKILKSGLPLLKNSVESSKIIIEDEVWINFNAIILKGVKIGKGSIIGAGAVVTKDVEPFTFVAGNPAKFVKKVY